MSLQVAGHQTEGYRINTTVYEGPLDLLLELIESAELDITRLALAQVTNQYLDYMRLLEDRNAAEVSAFLVIAARLVQIKSSALLPQNPAVERSEEEDPAEALAQQLILYRRFKQLALHLAAREAAGLHSYLRLETPSVKMESRLDMNGITLQDLVSTAYQIFIGKTTLPELGKVVNMPRVTIRQRIHTILEMLREFGNTSFKSLTQQQSRLDMVVTFLAMLELIKRRIIEAQQTDLFGDIQIAAATPLNEMQEEPTDLDFGD